MITIGDTTLRLDDPATVAALAALALGLCLLLGMVLAIRAVARSGRAVQPLAQRIEMLGDSVRQLGDGQHQLAGGLRHVSDAQATAQLHMIRNMEARLEAVQRAMSDSLQGSALRTTRSLGDLAARLEAIDKAQTNIEKLSGDVLGLQDILSNKQTRGAFGEIQLNDIVSKALPADAYAFQAVLSNGRRADCLIHLPNPPGPIVVDSKFPLEAYEALVRAGTEGERALAQRQMRQSVRAHIRAIAERYIIEGETADGALMFLPSEAVYAELHGNFGDVVREGFAARVWIVSPTTCMATLNTMRAVLKDARMREQAGAIRRELGLLYKDVERLETRVGNLDRHFDAAQKDLREIRTSAERAGMRARRLEDFEFEGRAEPAPLADMAPLAADRR